MEELADEVLEVVDGVLDRPLIGDVKDVAVRSTHIFAKQYVVL